MDKNILHSEKEVSLVQYYIMDNYCTLQVPY